MEGSTQSQSSRPTSADRQRKKLDRIRRRELHNASGSQTSSNRMYGMEKKNLKRLRKQEKERETQPKESESSKTESTQTGGHDETDEAAREAGNEYGFDITFGTGTQRKGDAFYRQLDKQLNKLLS